MAFSGGVFSLYTPGNPVVTGTVITSTWANNTLSDIATGLSTTVLKDGTQTLTANIPMAGYKLTGLASGSASTDSAQFGQMGEVLLYATTISATVSAHTITSIFTSAYQQYRIRVASLIGDTNSTALFVRVSTDGGTSYAGGSSDYQMTLFHCISSGGAATMPYTSYATASASGIALTPLQTFPAGAALSTDVIFNNPSSTTTYKTFAGRGVGFASPGLADAYQNAGAYVTTVSAVNAIKLTMDPAGNIASGKISVYGVRMA